MKISSLLVALLLVPSLATSTTARARINNIAARAHSNAIEGRHIAAPPWSAACLVASPGETLSIGFRVSVSITCYPNYGALTSTPAGLSPAEHASLRWTHNRACRFPAPGFPTGFTARHTTAGRLLLVSSDDTSARGGLRQAVELSLKVPDLIRRCQAHHQSPSPHHLQKRTRSRGPLLRRHYPASALLLPRPTPAVTTA